MDYNIERLMATLLATKNQQVKIICINEVKVGINSAKQIRLEIPLNFSEFK